MEAAHSRGTSKSGRHHTERSCLAQRPSLYQCAVGRLLVVYYHGWHIPVPHGLWSSSLVSWTATIRASLNMYGVYEADMGMMLHDLVI